MIKFYENLQTNIFYNQNGPSNVSEKKQNAHAQLAGKKDVEQNLGSNEHSILGDFQAVR